MRNGRYVLGIGAGWPGLCLHAQFYHVGTDWPGEAAAGVAWEAKGDPFPPSAHLSPALCVFISRIPCQGNWWVGAQSTHLAFWSKFGHFSVGRCRPGHWARELKTQGTLPIPPGHGKPPHGLLGVEPGAAWALQCPPKIRGLRRNVAKLEHACYVVVPELGF